MRPALLPTLCALVLLQCLQATVSEGLTSDSTGTVTTTEESRDADTIAKASDDTVTTTAAPSDAATTADATSDAATTGEASSDADTTAEASSDAATTAEASSDADTTAEASSDAATTAEASSDAATTAEASSDADTTAEASSDAASTAEASGDAATTAEASSDADTTAEASSDAATTAEASSDADTTAEASSDAATTADASSDAVTTAEASSDAASTAEASGDAATTAEASSDADTTAEASSDAASTADASSDAASSSGTAAAAGGQNSTSAAASTTAEPEDVPPAAPTVSSVNMKVRYTIPWNAEYAKSNSTEAEAKKQALKNNLEPPMKLKIPLMKELVINSLTQGSVVADYDVILNSDVEGGNVEAVTSAITEITANDTIGDDPVSANDTAVVVLECANQPEAAMDNGMRSWSGSRALNTMVLYTCRTGYTLKNNGQSLANFTVTCKRSGDALLFGGLPSAVSCVADPTTTTTTTTTTTEATTAEPTTTELTRPTPHETPYVPSEHTTFTNSLFLSITIPAVAGMVAALICFLCAIRIDSVLCKVCAEGKV